MTQDWSEKLKELGGAAYGNPPYSVQPIMANRP
ncbi:hypothetical protein [Morganella morganii]|nr:hypothetical protein [Morganella morganii]